MPLYEYICSKCDQQVELLVRSAQEQPECPACGSKQLKRLLSVAAAPSMGGKSVPMSSSSGGCGRPQCASGKCMFD